MLHCLPVSIFTFTVQRHYRYNQGLLYMDSPVGRVQEVHQAAFLPTGTHLSTWQTANPLNKITHLPTSTLHFCH